MRMSSKLLILAGGVLFFLSGCSLWPVRGTDTQFTTDPTVVFNAQVDQLGAAMELQTELDTLFDSVVPVSYVYPLAEYTTARTQPVFGQYTEGQGYHTGDDIKVSDPAATVPVYAITTATLVQKQTVSGYDGVVILEFVDNAVTYHALYGHINLDSVSAAVGDTVTSGTQLGVLADGEGKRLYFSIYPFTGTELYAEYVSADADLVYWENPNDWLREHRAL